MKNFRLYDITDFVLDEDFIRWVHEKNSVDNAFWNNWLRQHPDKHLVIAEARQIVESIKIEQKVINEQEVEFEIERLLQTIYEQPRGYITRMVSVSAKKWWYAAAVFIIAMTGIGYFFLNGRKESQKFAYATLTSSRHLIENVNTSNKPVTITLPDGSVIELASNSRVSYSNGFDSFSTRDIYLSGQAFFKVTKNPGRPFRVFANEIMTKVLGTSFTVRSFEKDATIQVTVRTGRVSVYSQAAANTKETVTPNKLDGIIVTPNQQLVYQKSEQKFQKILVESPLIIVQPAIDRSMVYEDTPVEKVFDQLSKYYGINILYDNELLKKCTVTADLTNETFYHKLDLICKAVGVGYEIVDGQVVIQTNGHK